MFNALTILCLIFHDNENTYNFGKMFHILNLNLVIIWFYNFWISCEDISHLKLCTILFTFLHIIFVDFIALKADLDVQKWTDH